MFYKESILFRKNKKYSKLLVLTVYVCVFLFIILLQILKKLAQLVVYIINEYQIFCEHFPSLCIDVVIPFF